MMGSRWAPISVFLLLFLSLAQATVLWNHHDSEYANETATAGGGTPLKRAEKICQPFTTTFSTQDISRRTGDLPFVAISPMNTYDTKDGNGLHMYLEKPKGKIVTHGHINNIVGEGATINSTFLIRYGKITFEMQAPSVAGSVTAAILISDGHDEIDIELVGGDEKHWQSNVYAPQPQDTQPLWGIFGEIHDVDSPSSITNYHNYTIDWNEERIIWSIDDHAVRTLTPAQTKINGTEHYPTQSSRIQLGIWDASNPEGTSEWAKGPIDWQSAPSTIEATIKGIYVECD